MFADWGRGSGKTEVAAAVLFIQAQLYPGSALYFISFTEENAREVVWQRLKQFYPASYVKKSGYKDTDLEVHFTNGSILYVRGSFGNINAKRGVQPAGVVFEEFRDHNAKFHDAFLPGVRLDHSFILYISTPPYVNEVEKWQLYSEVMENCKQSERGSYHHVSCWDGNPMFLAHYKSEQERLYNAGKNLEFQKEYEALHVHGSLTPLFPEFDLVSLVPHEQLLTRLKEPYRKLIWTSAADTSGFQRHGALFMALDVNNKEAFCLDCIINKGHSNLTVEEKDAMYMTGKSKWPLLCEKYRELNPYSNHKHWTKLWDCADIPVIDDIHRWYGNDIVIIPINKNRMEKAEAFGLIQDLKSSGRLHISDRCRPLIEEFQGLEIDPATRLPKRKAKCPQELIDCLRYIMMHFSHLFEMKSIYNSQRKAVSREDYFLQEIEKKASQPRQENNTLDQYYDPWSSEWIS